MRGRKRYITKFYLEESSTIQNVLGTDFNVDGVGCLGPGGLGSGFDVAVNAVEVGCGEGVEGVKAVFTSPNGSVHGAAIRKREEADTYA